MVRPNRLLISRIQLGERRNETVLSLLDSSSSTSYDGRSLILAWAIASRRSQWLLSLYIPPSLLSLSLVFLFLFPFLVFLYLFAPIAYSAVLLLPPYASLYFDYSFFCPFFFSLLANCPHLLDLQKNSASLTCLLLERKEAL